MKVIYILVLLFTFSCSTNSEKEILDTSIKQEQTYFTRIFTNSNPIFNGYNLGEKLSERIILTESLSDTDTYTTSILVEEDKINVIGLEVSIQNKSDAQELLISIVDKFNKHLDYKKPISNFVTWTYTKGNLPVEIILIYEEDLNTINLDIGYKSQR